MRREKDAKGSEESDTKTMTGLTGLLVDLKLGWAVATPLGKEGDLFSLGSSIGDNLLTDAGC